jgi:hypothetical protein
MGAWLHGGQRLLEGAGGLAEWLLEPELEQVVYQLIDPEQELADGRCPPVV